jgi:hypothetical protein
MNDNVTGVGDLVGLPLAHNRELPGRSWLTALPNFATLSGSARNAWFASQARLTP